MRPPFQKTLCATTERWSTAQLNFFFIFVAEFGPGKIIKVMSFHEFLVQMPFAGKGLSPQLVSYIFVAKLLIFYYIF